MDKETTMQKRTIIAENDELSQSVREIMTIEDQDDQSNIEDTRSLQKKKPTISKNGLLGEDDDNLQTKNNDELKDTHQKQQQDTSSDDLWGIMNDETTTQVELSETYGTGWPCISDELSEMMRQSHCAYAFADIRDCARKGLLKQEIGKMVLTTPVCILELCQMIVDNQDEMQKVWTNKNKSQFILQMIQHGLANNIFDGQQILVFNDENSNEELVYGIKINTLKKAITISFRGSVTVKDWMVDSNDKFHDVPYVVKSQEGIIQSETIGIHSGFYKYLHGTCRKKNGHSNSSKFDEIIGHTKSLLQKYPNFSIYTTGHSLGGALSTLFAFKACSVQSLPKPITCITVASPKVGDLNFRRAFKSLERQGLVRCLRVVNDKDIITHLPQRGRGACTFLSSIKNSRYRHVGIKLTLHATTPQQFDIHYSNKREKTLQTFVKEFGNNYFFLANSPLLVFCQYHAALLQFHSTMEYSLRLQNVVENLQDTFLNDYYNEIKQPTTTTAARASRTSMIWSMTERRF